MVACPVHLPTHSPGVDADICRVDPETHSPAVLQLIDVKISRDAVRYAVDVIIDTVDYALGRPSISTKHWRPEHVKFAEFVASMLERAEVTMPTLLVTLVYIQRAKHHLHIGLEQWALERVFLGALIVASKYLNDSTLKNIHWSMCTGIFGKRDIGRIEREYLDVLNFELAVTEDEISTHRQALKAVAHPPPSRHHSSVAMRLSRLSQELSPAHTYFERHPESHRRRRLPPEDVPPISPQTSDSMYWGDPRIRDNPNICGGRPRSSSFLKTTQAQLPHHDQPSILTMVPTLISQPVADHISEVLGKIRADTLCIACWEEPKNPAPNIAHLHDFSEILEVWKELDLLVRRPPELLSIWGLVEDYEKFIHELRLSISDGAHMMTEDMVKDFHQRLNVFVRDFKANAKASDNGALAAPPSQVPSTGSSPAFFKDTGKVGISGGHFVMNITQPIVPKPDSSSSSSKSETYLKEIRNFTYFRTFIELAILF